MQNIVAAIPLFIRDECSYDHATTMKRTICALVAIVASGGIACGKEAASPTPASSGDAGKVDTSALVADSGTSASPAGTDEGVAGIIAPQKSSGNDDEGRMGSKNAPKKPPPAAK